VQLGLTVLTAAFAKLRQLAHAPMSTPGHIFSCRLCVGRGLQGLESANLGGGSAPPCCQLSHPHIGGFQNWIASRRISCGLSLALATSRIASDEQLMRTICRMLISIRLCSDGGCTICNYCSCYTSVCLMLTCCRQTAPVWNGRLQGN